MTMIHSNAPFAPQTPAQGPYRIDANNVMKHFKDKRFDLREQTIAHDTSLANLFCVIEVNILDCTQAHFEKGALTPYLECLDLVEVYLDFTAVTDADLSPIQFQFDQLKVVSLQGCDLLTDKCLRFFESFKEGITLNLAQTKISKSAIQAFCENHPYVIIFTGENL
ncbi:MAG: hypothetical protein K940chlam8_00871 [Chlamydiae bacterium]|nr:hypothetical protein [Chlamydiota bacterium]